MTIAIESLRDTVRKILAPPPSGDKDISVAMIRALIRRPGLVDDARAVTQGDLGALNERWERAPITAIPRETVQQMIEASSNVHNYLPKSEMSRTALAFAAALALTPLLWAGAAHGYDAEAAKQLNKEQADLLERLRQMSVWPQHLPNPTRAQPKPNLVGTEQVIEAVYKPHVIYQDRGGKISDYYARYAAMAKQGYDVEIRGSCESACTLVTSIFPWERICFGDHAMLRFHKAHVAGNPSTYYTQKMVDTYPNDIKAWIIAMGDVENMPFETFWTLSASTLWRLGYRRCS